jgi:hypothetical protein
MESSERPEILRIKLLEKVLTARVRQLSRNLLQGRPIWIEPERPEIPLFFVVSEAEPASAIAKAAVADSQDEGAAKACVSSRPRQIHLRDNHPLRRPTKAAAAR